MTAPSAPRLLVVDDEPDLCTLYELTLVREGYDVDCAGSVQEAWQMLSERGYQLLITDMRLPDGDGLELLRRLEQAGRRERTIIITAYGSAENAVEALKAGAYDYLTKPVDLRQFRAVVSSALGRRAGQPARGEPTRPPPEATERPPHPALLRLVGDSVVMQQVRARIEKVARSMAPVLVSGESGTGKELVARAIHAVSARADGPFVAVNCGAIPETLLEAEFFGVRRGAFTGALEDRPGFFLAAQGGTIFLDEIGDLPLAMQSKLLRVIQERMVRPLGGSAESPVDVRVVSATHKDLAAEVQAGRFRQDLYYRLNVIQIVVPPLRERRPDLDPIARALLERIARDAGVVPVPVLSTAALQRLGGHPFPGNVRELENVLHRAVALSGGEVIEVDDIGLPVSEDDEAIAAPVVGPAPPVGAACPDEMSVRGEAPAGAGLASLPTDLAAHLDEVERRILLQALERHGYNRTAAGASMGLSLRQMRYRMARLGITVGDG